MHIFLLVYDSKIEIVEDVGTGVVDVRLVKTLVDSSYGRRGSGFPCTSCGKPKCILTNDKYAQLVDPEQEKTLLSSDTKG